MSKKTTEKKTEKTTEKTAPTENPLLAGPDDALNAAVEAALADLEEDDSHLQEFERVKMKKGQIVKGIFLGSAGVYPYTNEEGETVDIKLWRIKTVDGIIDLMGDYKLDDTFGGPTACAPLTPVKIECQGTESIEGSARQMNRYKIGRGKPISV